MIRPTPQDLESVSFMDLVAIWLLKRGYKTHIVNPVILKLYNSTTHMVVGVYNLEDYLQFEVVGDATVRFFDPKVTRMEFSDATVETVGKRMLELSEQKD
jgi:hypothetical protein